MRLMELACVACVVAACGDDGGNTPADAPPEDMMTDTDVMPDANVMPQTLAETGLCADAACATINAGVLAYAPQYELYSDTATKRRWIELPAGTQIDATDMNHWRFPTGTKLWKEFTRDGTRVETRFIWKIGDDDALQASWYYAAYKWDAGLTSTTLVSPGMGEMNANGTEHDIPLRSQCRRCHEGVPGRVLGVNAMSLDFTNPDGIDLAELVAMDLLTVDPAPDGSSYFPLPGTDVDKAAFGFMHGNCGGCHNSESGVFDTVQLELRMDVAADKRDTVATMPAYATTVNRTAQLSLVPGTLVIPDDAASSVVIRRMMSLVPGERMPEIGTETVNTDAIADLTAWIESL